MNNFAVKELYSEKHVSLPSINSLLKISLALILFTVISTALVYAETMSVDVDGTTFDFEYVATGLTVTSVESDSGFGSLLFTVDITDSVGTLNVVLERSFLDSTFNGDDDPFIIINQFGEDLIFTESTTSLSRTLNIELPVGTVEVDVIGTSFNNPISTNDSETDDKAAADKAAAAKKAAADKAAAEKTAAAKAAAEKAAAAASASDLAPPAPAAVGAASQKHDAVQKHTPTQKGAVVYSTSCVRQKKRHVCRFRSQRRRCR
jgi:hypothetical protein